MPFGMSVFKEAGRFEYAIVWLPGEFYGFPSWFVVSVVLDEIVDVVAGQRVIFPIEGPAF
jgi:hypothetical protein